MMSLPCIILGLMSFSSSVAAMPQIIPCVDIQSGRAVRLYEGDPDKETVYFDSPLEAALHWVNLGAPLVHLVDLDAATGRGENRAGPQRSTRPQLADGLAKA